VKFQGEQPTLKKRKCLALPHSMCCVFEPRMDANLRDFLSIAFASIRVNSRFSFLTRESQEFTRWLCVIGFRGPQPASRRWTPGLATTHGPHPTVRYFSFTRLRSPACATGWILKIEWQNAPVGHAGLHSGPHVGGLYTQKFRVDVARNPSRDVECGSILSDCPMPRTICVEQFVNRMGTNEYFIKSRFGCPHSVDNSHASRTSRQTKTRK